MQQGNFALLTNLVHRRGAMEPVEAGTTLGNHPHVPGAVVVLSVCKFNRQLQPTARLCH